MEWLIDFRDWFTEHKGLSAALVGASVLTLIISAIAVPVVIRRMPNDYFLENSPRVEAFNESHPVLRLIFRIFKNLFGGILLIGGILMLITPGQGVLTIMIGLMLTDFPGKRRLEVWLVKIKPINFAINWMRKKADKPPLLLPSD